MVHCRLVCFLRVFVILPFPITSRRHFVSVGSVNQNLPHITRPFLRSDSSTSMTFSSFTVAVSPVNYWYNVSL